ncbi:hypothetical protein WR25_01050 [Diploscapter pachys]|uniref:BZIP domain-containing protein n=1 Tax=Diploscapter pachys TaxID=2018661 RepID=A0A2A2JTC2_9BILA|nr:hypothetical protein WR25_01050 [Diploscapter pachys]
MNGCLFFLKNPQIWKLQNPMAIEDIVRLVVEALQKSNIGNVSVSPSTPTPSSQSPPVDENPQVILQRKRKQNNEAAARYRKRQKEAKEKAESELRDLERQNTKLRQAATEIETQISLLKQRMLMEDMEENKSVPILEEPNENQRNSNQAQQV